MDPRFLFLAWAEVPAVFCSLSAFLQLVALFLEISSYSPVGLSGGLAAPERRKTAVRALKRRKGHNMADNMENGTAAENQQEEKMFTQEEVNQIVGSRLARAKLDAANSKDFQEREANLNRRELELDAREALADAGLSRDLVAAINCKDKDSIKESIRLLKAAFSGSDPGAAGAVRYKVTTGTSSTSNGSGNRKTSDAEIRKAMGLKG